MLNTYLGGYTKALIDVASYVTRHSEVMKMNHMFSCKRMCNFLNDLPEHKEELIMYGEMAEFTVDKNGHIIKDSTIKNT